MSEPAPTPAESPKKKGKLPLLIAGAVLLLGGGVGGTWYAMGGAHAANAEHAEKKEPPKRPIFYTLDPFTVNLQDSRGDRFAQIGVTLQFEDPAVEMMVKDRLPAVRNEILLLIASKQMEELLTTEGKQVLANEIRERAGKAIGFEPPAPAASAAAAASGAAASHGTKVAAADNPIRGVLFSQFIVQ